jgi:hypothetical protein
MLIRQSGELDGLPRDAREIAAHQFEHGRIPFANEREPIWVMPAIRVSASPTRETARPRLGLLLYLIGQAGDHEPRTPQSSRLSSDVEPN